MRAAPFRCKMCGVTMYEGRAIADINLTGLPLAEALEAYICRCDPTLKNVQIRRATPTGDIERRVEPYKRWYEVIFQAEEDVDEDDDDDEDVNEHRSSTNPDKYRSNTEVTSTGIGTGSGKARGKGKAKAKAELKSWPPTNQGLFPPSQYWGQQDQ
jgi:hypothetical protein